MLCYWLSEQGRDFDKALINMLNVSDLSNLRFDKILFPRKLRKSGKPKVEIRQRLLLDGAIPKNLNK